jgi:microcystin-dependent protein
MALLHYLWSRVAANNATADANINWAEGQAPSSVNDSARAMMASAAAFRDDISGAVTTGGTSTAYTVSSFQIFDTLAHMDKMVIAFSPHTTNGATVTLNVDGLGAKPLRSSPSVELLAGMLIQGTPYLATYNNSDAVWYLQGFYGNPYNVPIGSGMDYWLPTAPNSSFVFPIGQAISRTTYSVLFAAMSTTYGVGDGSTTFNLPDKTGRISAMKEASATRLTSTYFGGNSANLGAVGGLESSTLVTGNLPPYTPAGSLSVASTNSSILSGGTVATFSGAPGANVIRDAVSSAITSTGTLSGTAQGGTSTPVRTVQPTIVCNYIMRII